MNGDPKSGFSRINLYREFPLLIADRIFVYGVSPLFDNDSIWFGFAVFDIGILIFG